MAFNIFRRLRLNRRKKRVDKNTEALSRLTHVNPFIRDIEALEYRAFYDSTWRITTAQGTTTIIRDDTETLASLCEALTNTTKIEDIRVLDMKNQILYD